jgi:hypothetical protein
VRNLLLDEQRRQRSKRLKHVGPEALRKEDDAGLEVLACSGCYSGETVSLGRGPSRDAGGRSGGSGRRPPEVHVKVKSKLVKHNN